MPDNARDPFRDALALLRRQEVGRGELLPTPFGLRRLCYADLTATGRHLRMVEEWIAAVRPFYANTHTEVSTTGKLMCRMRGWARGAVRDAVAAGPEDEVVFVGSGATAAVNKLVGLLGLRVSEPLERDGRLAAALPPTDRPVVLVGPYEHHSNELPWLESIADVVEVGLDEAGGIDLDELRERLREYRDRPLRIGSFSAASNVTGVLSDVRGIARELHRGGALAFFDYAAAAPYVPIDMHPGDADERIDAVFLSPHKMLGGPGASGVLVAHRSLFRSRTPERPGGGTVDYVAGPHRDDVDYVARLDEREEAGTPAILGDIRAGLAFTVKEWVGPEAIRRHETALAARAAQRLARHPRIRVLGPRSQRRLAIIPVDIEGLHHELVATLLDHLFGIQNRAGCSCAGPYGHRLLGIDHDRSDHFRDQVRRGVNGIKPGWARLSLPYYASEEEIDFILSATELIADHGLDFVPFYRLDWTTGAWDWRGGALDGEPPSAAPRAPYPWSMEGLLEAAGGPRAREPASEDELREDRRRYLAEFETIAATLRSRLEATEIAWNPPSGDPDLDALVWFRYVRAEGLERLA